MSENWTPISPSRTSTRLTNPIRDIVDQMKRPPPDPKKPLIALSIGDPTVFGNLPIPQNITNKLIENAKSGKFNGYAHSAGYADSREILAKKFSTPFYQLSTSDVILASGCSGALELAIGVLANEGDNLLIPAPGFSLYQTICEYKGIVPKHYKLLPEKSWEADLKHMESLIDKRTVAILLNNPSNPCGSVYRKEHLQDILKIAEKHHLPIIADEIYGDLVFEGEKFHSMASLSENVPILSVGGLAKLYLVPGWRVGWVLIHDRKNLFQEVRQGLTKLTQVILGANTLCQSILEEALDRTPSQYYQDLITTLHSHASLLYNQLSTVKGLHLVKPQGAMYMMVGIEMNQFPDFSNDVEFSKRLLEEEQVFVLPGTVFNCPNFVRLVICPPSDKLKEACERIKAFCERHSQKAQKRRKIQ